jgi:predicted transcriptional regulator
MGKYKKQPKYNVLSIRVTDGEKAVIGELKQKTSKSVSMLMREAIKLYTPQLKTFIK